MIGLGERSGYGLENIHNIWRKNDWEIPEIIESFQPETITLSLKTKKLISQNHLDTLKKSLDNEFDVLKSMEIKFLSFLLDKNSISHRDIQALLDINSIELSKMIKDNAPKDNVQRKITQEQVFNNIIYAYLYKNGKLNGAELAFKYHTSRQSVNQCLSKVRKIIEEYLEL